MTLTECYDQLEGNFEDVLGRLMDEKRVWRFASKFMADPTFESLCSTFEQGQYEEAFRAAHTLKGICSNLGFSKLYQSSAALTESLRGQKKDNADTLLEEVKKDYRQTVDALNTYQAQLSE